MPDDRSVLTRPAALADVVISYGSGVDNVADVRFGGERAAARPLVLLIHGGFWRPAYDRSHTGPMSVALAEAGWTVAAIEYRRVPQHPNLTIEDVTLAIRELPEKVSSHDGRVLLMGHSAGGHLVLWAAAQRLTDRVHGVVALAPAADLQLAHDLNLGDGATLAFLGEAPKNRVDLDPKRMPAPQVGVTIVHGEEDDIVPLTVAESYVATHPKTKFVKVPGAGHFAVIDPLSGAWPAVVAELETAASA